MANRFALRAAADRWGRAFLRDHNAIVGGHVMEGRNQVEEAVDNVLEAHCARNRAALGLKRESHNGTYARALHFTTIAFEKAMSTYRRTVNR